MTLKKLGSTVFYKLFLPSPALASFAPEIFLLNYPGYHQKHLLNSSFILYFSQNEFPGMKKSTNFLTLTINK